MNNPSGATLSDVAKAAGVSLATASRVLSHSDYPVRQELKQRVIQAASKLHYVPNVFGQMLRANSASVIGVIVPSLQNPFYNQAIMGVESAASKAGFEIRLRSSHRSVTQERNNILAMLHSRVMSLVLVSIDSNSDTVQEFIANGGRVALLEADFTLEQAIVAQVDIFSAGLIAAQHLIDHGHRDIAFLTSPLTKHYRQEVLEGVRSAMETNHIRFTEKDIFSAMMETESSTGMYEFEIGKYLAPKVLESRRDYTAIIAINDLVAYGVIQALSQAGFSVPKDISVIGFDNIVYSEMISPSLTTIELPSASMGFTACQMLISSVTENSALTGMEVRYPCALKARNSTRNINP